jgi:nitrogen fixation NifU-like protein
MNAELDALYQATILDHCRKPRNFRALADGSKAEGHNPLCGDRITVYLRLEDGIVADATFQGFGCALAMASASVMTEQLRGRTVHETRAAICAFSRMFAAPSGEQTRMHDAFAAFDGVRQFPSRIKCATLPWEACRAALAGDARVVSTEY